MLRRRRPTARHRLCYEPLESRFAMATFVVTSGGDSGPGSLREALESIGNTVGPDVIQFASNVQTVTLTSSTLFAREDGLLLKATGVTIRRSASSTVGQFGLLQTSGSMRIEGGRFVNGFDAFWAGAITAFDSLELDGVTFVGNRSGAQGGGAVTLHAGLATIEDCVFENNESVASGGAIQMRTSSSLRLTGSRISGNRASMGGGLSVSGDVEISNSEISNNESTSNIFGGGGIIASNSISSRPLKISNSTIINNISQARGGGIHSFGYVDIIDCVVDSNTAATSGGGIFQGSGTLNLQRTALTNNEAVNGGGMYLTKTTSLTALAIIDFVNIDKNTVSGSGGGIFSTGKFTFTSSSVTNNQAGNDGGGIWGRTLGSDIAEVSVLNSTISTNSSGGRGGGVYSEGNLVLTQATVASNSANDGGGLFTSSTEFFLNTLIADNVKIAGTTTLPSDIVGTVDVASFTLVEDTNSRGGIANGTNGNIVGRDARLGPLKNNGGSMLTHGIAANSPAVNAGDPNTTFGLLLDQRLKQRVQFGRIDMGAVELQPNLVKQGVTYVYTDNDGVVNDVLVDVTATGKLRLTDSRSLIVDESGTIGNYKILTLGLTDRLAINTSEGDDRVLFQLLRPLPTFSKIVTLDLGSGKDALLTSADSNFTLTDTTLIVAGTFGLRINHQNVDQVTIQGGAGNNRMDAGTFSKLLVLDGRDGNDVLIGGSGRNILIGGRGADRIFGGSQDDILLSGRTTLNVLDIAFASLVNEWNSGRTYATRLSRIRAGIGLAPGVRFDSSTVLDDTDVDTITGNSGTEWFWTFDNDTLVDRIASEKIR